MSKFLRHFSVYLIGSILLIGIVSLSSDIKADDNVFGSGILQAYQAKNYYQVMLLVKKKAEDYRFSLEENLAIAKSAWALGLVNKARVVWNKILANPDFSGVKRRRVMLSMAILELQEKRYEEARRISELAIAKVSPSNLRAQFNLVIAEALKAQQAYSKAESYYQRAKKEAEGLQASEAAFLLGECQLKIGTLSEARYSFASVSPDSPYAPKALSRLAKIDLAQGNFEGAITWIAEGRESYPEEFEGEWERFALISALLKTKRLKEAKEELLAFAKHYRKTSSWYTLAEADFEAAFAEQSIKGHRK